MRVCGRAGVRLRKPATVSWPQMLRKVGRQSCDVSGPPWLPCYSRGTELTLGGLSDSAMTMATARTARRKSAVGTVLQIDPRNGLSLQNQLRQQVVEAIAAGIFPP